MPRELSSDCGIAIRFARQEMELVRQLLSQAGVEVTGLHSL